MCQGLTMKLVGIFLLATLLNEHFVESRHRARSRKRSPGRYRRQSANDSPEWTYNGEKNGQEKWIDIGYEQCGAADQSPIKFTPTDSEYRYVQEMNLTGYDTNRTGYQLTNTGRVLELRLPKNTKKSHIPHFKGGELNGTFYFQKIIFHFGRNYTSGSEHTYAKGFNPNYYLPFAMEMQMIHQNEDDDIAIISNLYLANGKKTNPGFDNIIPSFPDIKYSGEETTVNTTFNISALFSPPFDTIFSEFYFRYTGSLTYPPCTGNVTWFILKGSEGVVGKKQLKSFQRGLRSTTEDTAEDDQESLGGNFRDLQPLDGRKYVERDPNKPNNG